jgi:hypothetical protein
MHDRPIAQPPNCCSAGNDICARELELISILATGEDGVTERAAIDNMYGTLWVTMQGLGMQLPKVDFLQHPAREVLHGPADSFKAGD